MRSKLAILLFILSLVPVAALSQEELPPSKMDLHLWTNQGFNMVDELFGQLSATATWHANPYVDLQGSLRHSSTSLLSAEERTTVKFPVGKGNILVQSAFLWLGYFEHNIQEFNTLITVGYGTPRFHVSLGTFNKFFSNIHVPYRNRDWVLEPLNVAYDAEVLLLKPSNKWNIGLRLTNIEELSIIRFHNPITVYTGYYKIDPNWQLEAGLRNHHAGIFDLTLMYYEITVFLGTKYSW